MKHGCKVLMKNWGTEHEEKIGRAIMGSVDHTEECFLAIGAYPAEGGFAEVQREEATNHLAILGDCWQRIEPELTAFAYEQLDSTAV